jgi:hypothetical protein
LHAAVALAQRASAADMSVQSLQRPTVRVRA